MIMISVKLLHLGSLMSIIQAIASIQSTETIDPARNDARPRRPTRYDQIEMNRCEKSTFEFCLSKMQEVMQNSSLAFPTNIEDLDLTCRKLKDGDYCAERYIRSCASDRQRGIYQEIVQGTKNVIRLLCQHGQTQQEYLRHAACFKQIFMDTCSHEHERFQGVLATMTDGDNSSWMKDEQHLQQFCCAYRANVDCQYRNVHKHCGENGRDFYKRYTSMMTDSLINEHCIGYTYSHKCFGHNQHAELAETIEASVLPSSDHQFNAIDATDDHNRAETHGSRNLWSISLLTTILICL